MSTRNEDEVRGDVTRAYAKAVTRDPGRTCCSGPVPKGEAAKLAGYTAEELAALPPEAVVHSFGCGNPLAFSEVEEGDVVVDLGSGAGIDVLIAARKVGPEGRVIGIDMTDEMIAQARKNIAEAGLPNAEVCKGLIEDLPVESSSVDWVISNCVINLSPEKPKVFAEIARVLRPGGRMLVSDIVVRDLPDFVRESRAFHTGCVAGALREEEYVEGLRRAGLGDVEVRDRLVYDASQLRRFLANDLADADPGVARWLETAGEEALPRLAELLAGEVWQASFFARKPGK